MTNRTSLAALTAAVAVGSALMTSTASAVGGNCSSSFHTSGNTHRASALCTSLQADSKARAKLIRSGGPDYHSSWFRSTYTRHYTGWYTCYLGCADGYEVAHI